MCSSMFIVQYYGIIILIPIDSDSTGGQMREDRRYAIESRVSIDTEYVSMLMSDR